MDWKEQLSTLLVAAIESPHARKVAALVLFGLMYALKYMPWVKTHLLTTPKRNTAANFVLALAPAVWLIADTSIPWSQVVSHAVDLALEAAGIHAVFNVLRGKAVSVPKDSTVIKDAELEALSQRASQAPPVPLVSPDPVTKQEN